MQHTVNHICIRRDISKVSLGLTLFPLLPPLEDNANWVPLRDSLFTLREVLLSSMEKAETSTVKEGWVWYCLFPHRFLLALPCQWMAFVADSGPSFDKQDASLCYLQKLQRDLTGQSQLCFVSSVILLRSHPCVKKEQFFSDPSLIHGAVFLSYTETTEMSQVRV